MANRGHKAVKQPLFSKLAKSLRSAISSFNNGQGMAHFRSSGISPLANDKLMILLRIFKKAWQHLAIIETISGWNEHDLIVSDLINLKPSLFFKWFQRLQFRFTAKTFRCLWICCYFSGTPPSCYFSTYTINLLGGIVWGELSEGRIATFRWSWDHHRRNALQIPI